LRRIRFAELVTLMSHTCAARPVSFRSLAIELVTCMSYEDAPSQ
jgi:hypothetical protein